MTEPAHDYTHTTYGGRLVNRRTRVMLEAAAILYGHPFTLTQGSYNAGGVAASAGTHDGGGVVDVNVNGMSASQRSAAEQALRKVGFFAWIRTPAQGFAYHIHAVAIGDRQLSSGARDQVVQGFQDRNGLAGRGPDPSNDPYPVWVDKYGHHVSLDRPAVRPVVRAGGPWPVEVAIENTRIVQRALNRELSGADLVVDGRFGPVTRAAYKRWQLKLGLSGADADGVPGPFSLGKLGAKQGFDVK